MQTASFASVAQLVEQWTENPRVAGSTPAGGTNFADVAHLVERHLAKVEVASSSLVIRSIFLVSFLYTVHNLIVRCHSQVVRQRSAKPRFPSSNLGGTSRVKAPKSLCIKAFGVFLFLTCIFAAVKQNSKIPPKLPNFCRILGCFANFAELILHTTPSVKLCIRYIPFLCIRQVSFRFFLFYYAFFIFYSLAFLMST